MKNLIIRILSVALICCMVFSFAACKDKAADDQGTTPPTAGDTNTGDDNGDWFEKDEGTGEGTGEGEGDTTDEPCVACVDEDGDLTCDVCGGEVEPEEWVYNGIEWQITRGGGCFKLQYQVNGTEYHVVADNAGDTYNWLAQANEWSADYAYENLVLEEGTIEAKLTTRVNTGVVFGATGMDLPRNSGDVPAGTTAPTVSSGKDIFYYYIGIKPKEGKFGLYVDDTDDKLTLPATIQEVTITDIIPTFDMNGEITIKVEFTKAGAVKISLNGTQIFDLTGYEPFGTEFGMMIANDNGFTKQEQVCELISYTYAPKA